MALIHRARLSPTKHELLSAWLPSRPWSGGASAAQLDLVGAYRFDDPEDAVGIETHLARTAGGRLLQVPLTYRGAPLDGAEDAFVGTTEHSHLGRRWVYDGCADPVYAAALATAISTGGRHADEWVEQEDGRHEQREVRVPVLGSGTPGTEVPGIDAVAWTDDETTTTVECPGLTLVVRRVLDARGDGDGDPAGDGAGYAGVETLTGTWPGQTAPALLAYVRPAAV